MLLVPGDDRVGETGVEDISRDIISVVACNLPYFLAEQWRYRCDIAALDIPVRMEREGEDTTGSDGGQFGEPAQPLLTVMVFLGKLKVGMEEKILMPDTNLRRIRTEEEISQAAENFIKINHQIRMTVTDTMPDLMDTCDILWRLEDIIYGGTDMSDMAVVFRGEKIRAVESHDRSLGFLIEEGRDLTVLTLTDKHAHYLMTVGQ